MYRTQILAAGIAYASAITIKAETEAEWGWFNDAVSSVGDAFDDVGDFVTDDVGSFFTDDVGGFFNDVGNTIGGGFTDLSFFLGNGLDDAFGTIGNAFDDAWGWVSDGSNWEALGTTLLGGTVALLSGNPDQAI